MTLRELHHFTTNLLEGGHSPDARVLVAEQPHWPFEYRIAGGCTREDLLEYSDDQDDSLTDGGMATFLRENQKKDDIILGAGDQLGYGDKCTWDAIDDYKHRH